MTVAACKRDNTAEPRLHSSRCLSSSSPSEILDRKRISDISSRIFSPTTTGFDVFDLFEDVTVEQKRKDGLQSSQPRVIHHRCSEANAAKILSDPPPDASQIRIISIAAPGTTSPLGISFAHASLLWENLELESEFRDVISSFGTAPVCGRAGSSGAFLKSYGSASGEAGSQDGNDDDQVTASGYILQYLEENNRSEQKPWSHRHSALYHRHIPARRRGRREGQDASSAKPLDIYVLLHSTHESTFAREIRSLRGSPPSDAGKDFYRRLIRDPFCLHEVLFQLCLSDWTWYTRFIGAGFERASDRLMTTYRPSTKPQLLDYEAFRELRQTLDDVLSAGSYCRALRDVVDMFEDMRKIRRQSIKPEWLSTLRRQCQGHVRGLTGLQARLENSLAVFEYSFNLKTDQISTEMNQSMLDISNLTFDLTRTTQELTQTAVEDSAAIRAITVVSLFFLPGAFMSSVFGMNFFNYDGQTNGMVVGNNLWWYIASWLALTLLTFMAVELFDRRRKTVNLIRSKSGLWSSGGFSRTSTQTRELELEPSSITAQRRAFGNSGGSVHPFSNGSFTTTRRNLGQGTV